ncbi:hypothetical protein [Methanothrix soehngenii]|jgi:hypothetical protein|uniref:hypothetical protein n=2 Tax=Methanothrix soehngenii TaxID=2223 RepID=UPI0023F548CE|nr:hypothetical protein [Methanothrix soehngenii]MDD5736025.1 hypothetical protein [Methanothrix soehngenii]
MKIYREDRMKLSLIKNQSESNVLWKRQILYSLSARAELTEEETELMNNYKLKKMILSSIQIDEKHEQNVTMEMLMIGCIFENELIDRILAIEQEIKNSCQIFKTHMDVRKNFYGEEIIEY